MDLSRIEDEKSFSPTEQKSSKPNKKHLKASKVSDPIFKILQNAGIHARHLPQTSSWNLDITSNASRHPKALEALRCFSGDVVKGFENFKKLPDHIELIKVINSTRSKILLKSDHVDKRSADKIIKFNSKSPQYAWLSNFFETIVVINGDAFHSSEHAYQSIKFPKNSENYLKILRESDPEKAKKLGKKIVIQSDKKLQIMEMALKAKFGLNPFLQEKLAKTVGKRLSEDTQDNFWSGEGNELGKLLEKIRA